MSMLEDMLQEERQRSLRMREALQKELAQLPRGYISRKIIRGRPVYYLQRREGKRILSQYIPRDQLAELERSVARRKELQSMSKAIDNNLKRIQKALKG